MIIYKDIISGDELFSDAFEIEENFQGAFYKLKPKKIKVGATQLDGAAFGFNASEEGGEDEGVDDSAVVMKWDVEDQHQLETVPPFANSKEFVKGYFKEYCKKVKGILEEDGKEDEAKEWMKQAASGLTFMKKQLTNKDDGYELFIGQKQDYEGSMGYINWDENDEAFMLFFKHAIVAEKV